MKAGNDPDERHRRSIRLKGFNYTLGGAYFMTVCTQNQMCLFGDVVEREIRLNDAGRLVQIVWDGLPEHYPHVSLDHWVIMPNHVHGIVSFIGAGLKPAPMTTATNRLIPRKTQPKTSTLPPRRPKHFEEYIGICMRQISDE
jgi:hypothetical protein